MLVNAILESLDFAKDRLLIAQRTQTSRDALDTLFSLHPVTEDHYNLQIKMLQVTPKMGEKIGKK